MVSFIKRFGALAAGFATCIALATASAGAVAAEPTLKVGATATGVPFTFLDVKSNSIQGMMVDAITAAGKSAGFRVDVQQTVFSALIPSLTTQKIDIISAAMLKTPARQQVVDFSDTVY